MSTTQLPPDVREFVRRPQPAVIAWRGPRGNPRSVATWYDWENGRALVNMHANRKRLRWITPGAPVSLTILDGEDWYRHVTVVGTVSSVADDEGLADIDRLARRYTGAPYRRRGDPRVSAWIEVQFWYGWSHGEPW